MTAPYDVALAGLMHDFGDQWQIAFEQDVNAWTALKRPPDGRHIRYLVAHEADALRRKIEDCSEDDEHPFGGGASLFDPPRLLTAMSTTPAAELARLKLRCPLWVIGKTEGVGYLALGPGGEHIETQTLAELEQTLERLRWRPKAGER